MKTLMIRIVLINFFAALIISFFSCKKDKMIPPTVDFKTGGSYTSADGHIALNTAFTVGIVAKRTEAEDDLKTFTVTRSYDGGIATTLNTITLTSAQAGEFDQDFSFTTRNTAGTEKYTFTVTNRDGLVTSKSLTITVP